MKTKAEEYNSSLIDEIFDSISPNEENRIKSKMLLAAKIEDAMKAKGWNRTKLLKATGQKNASVATKWFSGTHNFTHDTLFDIQEALGIDLLNTSEKNEEVVVKYRVVVQSTPTLHKENSWQITDNRKSPKSPSQIHSFNTSMIIAEA
jgi:transcriptional regulator with XRE-family HTH domain